MKKCYHFEWIDEYVDRIQFEGYVDSSMAATRELNLGGVPPISVENTGSSGGGAGRVVPMAMYARNAELHAESELTEELKKIKKHLMQKQANIMAEGSIVVSLLCFCFTCCSSVIRGGI